MPGTVLSSLEGAFCAWLGELRQVWLWVSRLKSRGHGHMLIFHYSTLSSSECLTIHCRHACQQVTMRFSGDWDPTTWIAIADPAASTSS